MKGSAIPSRIAGPPGGGATRAAMLDA
jgi:hypothetical protein